MLKSRKKKEKIVIAPGDKIKIISGTDKRNKVDITNENGKIIFDITYVAKHRANAIFKAKESSE